MRFVVFVPISGRRLFFFPKDRQNRLSYIYREVKIVKEALMKILAAAKADLEQAGDLKALEEAVSKSLS